MSKTPNEKVCEELFLAYTLQYARSGKLILYAPSQREELLAGYDAALFTGECRELVLQFKRAYVSGKELYFNIDENQRRILQTYPPNVAFYVVGAFDSLSDLFEAQSDQLTVSGFLDRYLAISAYALLDGKHVHFKKNKYKDAYYRRSGGSTHPLNAYQWFTGSELLKRFLHPTKFEVGRILRANKHEKLIEVQPNPNDPEREGFRSLIITEGWLSNLLVADADTVSTVFIRYCISS